MICDTYNQELPSTRVKGRNDCRPNWLNGTNTLKLESDATKTPQYSVAIGDLFPGLFQQSFQLPLGLIQEEILLDINFSRNGELGNNDRAIFCPSLSTQTANSVISLGLQQSGEGSGGAQTDLVLTTHTGSASGTGLKLVVDLDAGGITTNIRVLDGGKGYAPSEALTFTHAELDTDPLIVVPAYNFTTWNSATNFYVDAGNAGAGYVVDTSYEVTNPVNPALNFKVTATAVNAGGLSTCQLASVADNNNMAFNSDYNEPYDVAGGAKIYVIKNTLTITNAAGNGAFVVGDVVVDHAEAGNTAVVAAIDGDDRPTSLHVIKGSFADGVQLDKLSDATINCTLTAITATNEAFETCGLGLDPLFNFDNNNASDGKVNVDTANVFLATDLIFYMDGKFERDSKQMMEGGITVNYTQFINVKSDLTDEADSVTDYGQSETQTHNRLIGFSNSVIRNLMFNCYNSGVVRAIFHILDSQRSIHS